MTLKNSTSQRPVSHVAIFTALIFYAPHSLSSKLETPWECESPESSNLKYSAPPVFDEANIDQTKISADKTSTTKEGQSHFLGNVIIEKHQLHIDADKAVYNPNDESLDVTGNVHVDIENMSMNASSGELSTQTKSSKFNHVEFMLPKSQLKGKAKILDTSDEETTNLTETSITTCDPADPDWRLSADEINIDHEEEYGNAEGVVLRFKEIPFLYIPYMEFPVGDKRRSGLLVPEFGNSDARGFEVTIPWYWNIAPNHDAILAPHTMSKRGEQLDANYRFLTESSKGELVGSFLDEDKITREKRYQYQYKQSSNLGDSTKLTLDVQDVSDIDYFNDFSSNLSVTSKTHLSKNAKIKYDHDNWQASLLAQTYKTLDITILPVDRPYKKLPQVRLNGSEPVSNSGFEFILDSEWVYFDHEDTTKVTGSRTNLTPGVHWLFNGSYWYIDPSVKYSHTQYEIEDGSGNSINIEDRNLATSSLDAGLFFERETGGGLVQTLEPRLFYLNTPFRDQNGLPLFDTGLPTFNFSQLFRDNRFNGGDRIGDANQITVALSSRIINPLSGDEYFRASLGQITYFEDRLVTLTNVPEQTNQSDFLAEISTTISNWRIDASAQWNTDTEKTTRENLLIHYKSDQNQILNLGYRMDRSSLLNDIEQTDLSFIAPVTSNIDVFARWNYSLIDNKDIDVYGGLSYDSCCWSIQLLAQRHLISSTTAPPEYDNSIMMQFVLKGLGSISGNKVSDTLSQSIIGYDENF